MTDAVEIAGTKVSPGERQTLTIPVSRGLTTGETAIPVAVINGRRRGPVLFVSAALHGDEINGTEIIRRLLQMPLLRRLRGTLIAVPVVNVYGFMSQSRYLPDRRDLNRSFPGSSKGSLASRLAKTFLDEIVSKSTHGIDLHTGALHRSNLPQIRAALDDENVEAMARAFRAPVILDAGLREGSLREAAYRSKVPVIVYEAGEALRFDEVSIQAGLRGVLSTMRHLGMLPVRPSTGSRRPDAVIARDSTWVRAPDTGILQSRLKLGARVTEGESLGAVSDPLGETDAQVICPVDGLLIGCTGLPIVREGDALFHVATFKRLTVAAGKVDAFHEAIAADDPLL